MCVAIFKHAQPINLKDEIRSCHYVCASIMTWQMHLEIDATLRHINLGQPRVNLTQRPSWVWMASLQPTKKGNSFDLHKPLRWLKCLLVAKQLVIENFWSPYVWRPKLGFPISVAICKVIKKIQSPIVCRLKPFFNHQW
jgi:hypothetical protein